MRSIVGKLSTKVDAPAALARRIGAELDSRLQRKHRFCDELSNALMSHSISRRNSMRVWLSVRKTPRMTDEVIRPGIRISRGPGLFRWGCNRWRHHTRMAGDGANCSYERSVHLLRKRDAVHK